MGPFCVGARRPETQPRTSLDFHPRARSAAGGEVWERCPYCLDWALCWSEVGGGGHQGFPGVPTDLLWGMGKLEGQSGPLRSLAPRRRGYLLFCFRPSVSDRMGFW